MKFLCSSCPFSCFLLIWKKKCFIHHLYQLKFNGMTSYWKILSFFFIKCWNVPKKLQQGDKKPLECAIFFVPKTLEMTCANVPEHSTFGKQNVVWMQIPNNIWPSLIRTSLTSFVLSFLFFFPSEHTNFLMVSLAKHGCKLLFCRIFAGDFRA